jgi:undecaprenyl-diphosphatase
MNLVEAFVLGAIQGISEWLPISSSGHLVLAQSLFDLDASQNLLFDLIVHLGTLLAVCAYFHKELGRIIVSMLTGKAKRDAQMNALRTLGLLLLVATIPVGVVGVILTSSIESLFAPETVACALVVNGLLLFVYSRYGSKGERRNATLKDAIVIGLFQAVSIVPGISRSGSTLGGGMLRGLEREVAAVFAFLVSVPTLVGALGYGFLTLDSYELGLGTALTGLLVAFATGILSIQYLLKFVRKGRLWVFGVYCVAAGIVALALLLWPA